MGANASQHTQLKHTTCTNGLKQAQEIERHRPRAQLTHTHHTHIHTHIHTRAHARTHTAGGGGAHELEQEEGEEATGLHWKSEVPRPKQRPSERQVMQTRVVGEKEKGLAKQVCG